MSVRPLVWTGRLEFDLNSGRGFAIATVDVSMRLDVAIFWISSRTIACIDRDRLREWFIHPHAPLAVDDVEFCMLGNDLCFKVDGSIPYVLPDWLIRQLASLL